MAKNYERTLKYGDTGEPVSIAITQASDGTVPDWSSADVRFIMYQIDTTTGEMSEVINKAGSVADPAESSGTLLYNPESGDFERVGRFPALFKVTKDSVIEHYPRADFIWLTVEEIPNDNNAVTAGGIAVTAGGSFVTI